MGSVTATESKTAATAERAEAELAARLRLSVMRLARRLRQQAEAEVTASQLSALSSLTRAGSLTLGELSAVERVKPPTMTRIVAGLEELRLVTRTVDPLDRRVSRVDVSEQGQRFVNRSRYRKDAYLAARMAVLSPNDLTKLTAGIEALERLLDDSE